MINQIESWHGEHSTVIKAGPSAVWSLFRDVASWKTWNAGIEEIEIEGPFASGTWFRMKPSGQDVLRSRLVDVRENEGFVDETRVEDLVIKVAHRIEPFSNESVLVTFATDAVGPGATDIGPAVSSDFPEVLAALAELVVKSSVS